MLRYGCLLLGLLLLGGCKSVDVPIYAAYPLAKEKAVVMEPLSGATGCAAACDSAWAGGAVEYRRADHRMGRF